MTEKEKKQKSKEYFKKWYEKNKKTYNEKRKQKTKGYYEKNKEVINQKHKKYYEENKESIKLKQKEYRENNKERLSEYGKEWRQNNKENRNEYEKSKKNTDPLYKLTCNTRSYVTRIIKENGYSKKSKINEIVGCSFTQLKEHLENNFESWMTWENHGKYNGDENYGWDVDHIVPLSSAENEEQLMELFHYSNLQPLCSYKNRDIKRNNY